MQSDNHETHASPGNVVLHVLHEDGVRGYGIVLTESGQFLCALSPNEVRKMSINGSGEHLNGMQPIWRIIDPSTSSSFPQNWQKQAIDNFNLYFARVLGYNSPLMDSTACFGDVLDPLLRKFASEGSLLDVGAGSSRLASGFSSAVFADIAYADKNYEPTQCLDSVLVAANARNLPFEDSSFDAVLCAFVLEHVPDPFELIGEMVRVLKPRGRILLCVPSLGLVQSIRVYLLRKRISLPVMHLRAFGCFSTLFCQPLTHIRKSLLESGAKVIGVTGAGLFPRGSLFGGVANKILGKIWPLNYLGLQTMFIGEKRG